MTVAASVISTVPTIAWIAPPPTPDTFRIDSLKNARSNRSAPRAMTVMRRLRSGISATPNAVQTSAVTRRSFARREPSTRNDATYVTTTHSTRPKKIAPVTL